MPCCWWRQRAAVPDPPPVGEVMPIGGHVEGRGGYFYLSDVNLFAGAAARSLAARCLDGDQIVVVENADTAIGPKDG